MKRSTTARRHSLGFTLVELCASVGIGAALLSQAVPAMTRLQQEQRLRASAELLATDLRLARSEAVRSGETVFLRFSGKGANACYVLHTGATKGCDCAGGQAVCTAPGAEVIRAEWLPAGQPLQLSSNVETLRFEHRQGLVTPTGSVELGLAGGATIRQVVAITGRVRSCHVGDIKVSGMPKCA